MKENLSGGAQSENIEFNTNNEIGDQIAKYIDEYPDSSEDFLKNAARRLEGCTGELLAVFSDLQIAVAQLKEEGVEIPVSLEKMTQEFTSFPGLAKESPERNHANS